MICAFDVILNVFNKILNGNKDLDEIIQESQSNCTKTDSQNITTEFLNEFKNYLKFKYATIVKCLSITQDPETMNYRFVMQW
ncbi:hypothetical protein Glove_1096g3 [Diversispora epigaea]|uniref:Uncharacterized protein n=1 Tax=Diversispora epigaea TaxID=1348612 RepID=A0A397G1R9_9GLOM|nr:hypothetical protein Glove_1096g3 [Diversispora epigaea]